MACPSPELAELLIQQMRERDEFLFSQAWARAEARWARPTPFPTQMNTLRAVSAPCSEP